MQNNNDAPNRNQLTRFAYGMALLVGLAPAALKSEPRVQPRTMKGSIGAEAVAPAGKPLSPSDPRIVRKIRRAFWKTNARIETVTIVDVDRSDEHPDRYLVLARGIRGDNRYEGSLNDELFGLFIVDTARRRIAKQLAMIPTPRWNDYNMHIESVTDDAVILTGEGATYKDHAIRLSYPLHD